MKARIFIFKFFSGCVNKPKNNNNATVTTIEYFSSCVPSTKIPMPLYQIRPVIVGVKTSVSESTIRIEDALKRPTVL